MSATIMFRKCQHCGHKYTYNPSNGNFGFVCPRCGMPQSSISQTTMFDDIFPSNEVKEIIDRTLGRNKTQMSQRMPLSINVEELISKNIYKTIDAIFIRQQKPRLGSVVYCNLAGVFEHTGIFVGGGKIVHLDGEGMIEKVSYDDFVNRLDGNNPAITIFCPVDSNNKSIGDEQVAQRALAMVGSHRDYNLIFENCHKFTLYCLTGKTLPIVTFNTIELALKGKYLFANWRAIDW